MTPRPRRRVLRADFERSPNVAWNAFVDLLVRADPGELTTVQRTAWLAWWYDAEIQNGGHQRFLALRGARWGEETLSALERLGGEAQREVLALALLDGPGAPGDLDTLDRRFHACEPSVHELLHAWLEGRMDEFILLDD